MIVGRELFDRRARLFSLGVTGGRVRERPCAYYHYGSHRRRRRLCARIIKTL